MPTPSLSKAGEWRNPGTINIPYNTNLLTAITASHLVPTLNTIPFLEIAQEHAGWRMFQFINPPKGDNVLGVSAAYLMYFVDGAVFGFGQGYSAHTGSSGFHYTLFIPNAPKAIIVLAAGGGDNVGISHSCNTGCGGSFVTVLEDVSTWQGYHIENSESVEQHSLRFSTAGTPTWSMASVGIVVGYKSPMNGDSLKVMNENGISL